MSGEILGEAAFELGQYYFALNNFANTIKYDSIAVDLVNDDELRTQIYFK